MDRKFSNHWVECRDPMDLMNCPSKETNNKQTYNHINHLMVNLETNNCIRFYDIYCTLKCS